ncbi:MAG: chromosomal replication initiator DnaA [Parasphingopyxis sp.]|uniref:HdaA/DnaA family protein n=1 Tax=Parasphingopyxis sp. TaxID=1920299 RepID=UPI00260DE141|nr:chromosomal replication initiator DnaA [uncultured Parasphingopyxis sp.]
MRQIPLPLDWPDQADDDAFILDESNRDAVRHLEHWSLWPVRISLLTGPRKSGRSTLARLFARKSGGDVFDDADLGDEEEIFHAWNRAQAEHKPLLIVANAPPPVWHIRLPDLRSRMAATPKVEIGEPSDMLIGGRIVRHFASRGLDVGPDVVDYLLTRMERTHFGLFRLIEAMDRIAMESGRRISRALARDALDELRPSRDR